MKVGVLYIATGEYVNFWSDFYKTASDFFCPGSEVHFFVYTDDLKFFNTSSANIHLHSIKNLSWPYITLYRFNFFLETEDQLREMNYLVFCNSNLLFRSRFDILDCLKGKSLFAVVHPGHYRKDVAKLPLEKNIKSSSFFIPETNDVYVCGGFNGGKSASFLAMAKHLSNAITGDEEIGIIAIWHDETHLNCFYHNNKELFNILPPKFCSPRDITDWGDVVVSVRDKHEVISLRHKGLLYVFKYYIRSMVLRILSLLGVKKV
jgi:hypothetical protein